MSSGGGGDGAAAADADGIAAAVEPEEEPPRPLWIHYEDAGEAGLRTLVMHTRFGAEHRQLLPAQWAVPPVVAEPGSAAGEGAAAAAEDEPKKGGGWARAARYRMLWPVTGGWRRRYMARPIPRWCRRSSTS